LNVVKEQRRRDNGRNDSSWIVINQCEEEEDEEEIEEETEDETEEGAEEEVGAGEEEDSQPANAGIPIKKEVDLGDTSCVNIVTFRVKDQTGEETMFKVKNTTSFGRIINAYANRKGVRAVDLSFLLDGHRIEPYQTIADLDLEDEDQVDCFLNQSGC
jgi:small ubiquitin-related modifier